MRIIEPNLLRRIAAVVGTPAFEDLHQLLREHRRELVAPELSERRIAKWVRAPIAALVGDDQVKVATVPQRTVGLEAVDRRQVVRCLLYTSDAADERSSVDL